MADNMLFATLDPTMRRLELPSGRTVILSDTVGFISELPTHLVAAFRATLEEVTEADLVIHVRDAHHPDSDAQCRDVLAVLSDLGLDEAAEESMIEALNKIDLLDPAARVSLEIRLRAIRTASRCRRRPERVAIACSQRSTVISAPPSGRCGSTFH